MLCLLCCAAYNLVAQTTQTPTDLYIKLPDASGMESNAYVPEMNLFVANMVKELPAEFQDGKFKVFEMGCYSIQEYTTGGYKEAVEKYFRNDSISNAKNALFIGKRCENGIFTSFYADIKLNHALEGCLDKGFPTWRTVFSKKINDAINLEMKNNKISINQTHLAIKKGLLTFQNWLPYLLEDCEDNMMLMQPNSFVVGFKSNTRSATEGLDFKKPIYFFYNRRYVKIQFNDKIKSIDQYNNIIVYKDTAYSMLFTGGGFFNFCTKIDKNGKKIVPSDSTAFSYIYNLNSFKNCNVIPYCRASSNTKCKLDGNIGFILLEEGEVNDEIDAWRKYLSNFDEVNKAADFQEIFNKIFTLEPFELKKFLIVARDSIVENCSTNCGNLDLATLSTPPIKNGTCQICIINTLVNTLYANYESVIKELVAKLPADKLLDIQPNKDRIVKLFKQLEDNPQAYTFGTTSELCSILEYLAYHIEISNRNRQIITIFNKVSAENTPSFIDTLEQKTISFKKVITYFDPPKITKYKLIQLLYKEVSNVFFKDDLYLVNAIRDLLLRNKTVLKKKYDEAIQRNLDGGNSLVVLGEPVTSGKKPILDFKYFRFGEGSYNRIETEVNWKNDDLKLSYTAEEFNNFIMKTISSPNSYYPIGAGVTQKSLGKVSYDFSPFDLVMIYGVQDIESLNQLGTLVKSNDVIADSTSFEKTPNVFFMPAIGLYWGQEKRYDHNAGMLSNVAFNVWVYFTGIGGGIKLAAGASEYKVLQKAAYIIEKTASPVLKINSVLNLALIAKEDLKGTPIETIKNITDVLLITQIGIIGLDKGLSRFSTYLTAREALSSTSAVINFKGTLYETDKIIDILVEIRKNENWFKAYADHPKYKDGIEAVKNLEKELWEAFKREPNFGFIEGTFQARFAKAIEAEGLINKILNLQKSVVNENINIIAKASNNSKGAWGEMVSDVALTEKGFTPLHTRKTALTEGWGETGLDGVFLKNGEYYIIEAKYTGLSKLSVSADGKQLSKGWIEGSQRLEKAVGENIAQDIIQKGYKKIWAQVSPDGKVTFLEVTDDFATTFKDFKP